MTRAMDLEGNHNMDWFFNEYVYGTGIAQYHMDYTVQSQPGNKWLLSGTATQSGVPDGGRTFCHCIYTWEGNPGY
jgi:hypothetical protein